MRTFDGSATTCITVMVMFKFWIWILLKSSVPLILSGAIKYVTVEHCCWYNRSSPFSKTAGLICIFETNVEIHQSSVPHRTKQLPAFLNVSRRQCFFFYFLYHSIEICEFAPNFDTDIKPLHTLSKWYSVVQSW